MTQAEKLGKRLLKMKKNITTQDKKDCMEKFEVHANTVQNYLTGKGKDADLYVKMISFFNEKIEMRNQILEPQKSEA